MEPRMEKNRKEIMESYNHSSPEKNNKVLVSSLKILLASEVKKKNRFQKNYD